MKKNRSNYLLATFLLFTIYSCFYTNFLHSSSPGEEMDLSEHAAKKIQISFLLNPADENEEKDMPIVETEEEEEQEVIILAPKKSSLSFIVNPLNHDPIENRESSTIRSCLLAVENSNKKYWNAIEKVLVQNGINIEHTKRTLSNYGNLGISTHINNDINQQIIEALHKEKMTSKDISSIVNVNEESVKNYLDKVQYKEYLSNFNISQKRQTAIPSQHLKKSPVENKILHGFPYSNAKKRNGPNIQHTYPSGKRKRTEIDQNNPSLQSSSRAWSEDMIRMPPKKKAKGIRSYNTATSETIRAARAAIQSSKWPTIIEVLVNHGVDETIAKALKSNGEKPWKKRRGFSKQSTKVMDELINKGFDFIQTAAVLGIKPTSLQSYYSKPRPRKKDK